MYSPCDMKEAPTHTRVTADTHTSTRKPRIFT